MTLRIDPVEDGLSHRHLRKYTVELDLDGNITLRGSSAVRILIDGRPSRFSGEDLCALLQSLPGNSVEKIEVMTNPSAKYDPDGTAGMINIVLKKSALQGLNGSVNASYSGADRVRAGMNLNYKVNDVNFFLNMGHSSGRYPRSSWTRRDSFLGEDTLSFYQLVQGYGGQRNNIKAGSTGRQAPSTSLPCRAPSTKACALASVKTTQTGPRQHKIIRSRSSATAKGCANNSLTLSMTSSRAKGKSSMRG